MHKLPIGIQDFPKIRENGFHYVDKTAVIHRLLNAGTTFFLSRPRHFGKSLLCSTLGAIFNARRDLFKGLAIDSLDWKWKKHPVIRLDLNAGEFENGIGHLRSAITYSLEHAAVICGVTVRGDTPATMLGNLILDASARFNEKAVVIIDEYDKPLLSTIDKPELHTEIRTVLKGFYGVLKQSDANLAFIFFAGVTKFSQVSVFSDLNQLQDISMDARFCDICGIRQDELERDFAEEVTHYAQEKKITGQEYLDKLRKWYNGYHFSESPIAVYNLFGLLNHFATGKM
jgi:hypothetical protein